MAASRSVQIFFTNQTSQTLTLPANGASLSGGIWSAGLTPPSTIPGNSTVNWQSESDGFLTGTQGIATYVFADSTTNTEFSVTVSWDNPYDGSSTYLTSVAPQAAGYQSQGGTSDNDADNATFNVSFSSTS